MKWVKHGDGSHVYAKTKKQQPVSLLGTWLLLLFFWQVILSALDFRRTAYQPLYLLIKRLIKLFADRIYK